MIFDIENAGGVIRALDEGTGLRKTITFIAQQGAEQGAAKQVGPLPHPIEKVGQLAAAETAGFDGRKFDPCRIDGLPHFARQSRADSAAVIARGFEAGAHRGGVLGIKQQEMLDIGGGDFGVPFQKGIQTTSRDQR